MKNEEKIKIIVGTVVAMLLIWITYSVGEVMLKNTHEVVDYSRINFFELFI